MARKKKVQEPCPFCEDSWQDSQNGYGKHAISVEFYPENGLFALTGFAVGYGEELEELTADYTFEFCPMCGRKIGFN